MEQGSKPRARTDDRTAAVSFQAQVGTTVGKFRCSFDFNDLENRMIAFFGFSNLRFAWELALGFGA